MLASLPVAVFAVTALTGAPASPVVRETLQDGVYGLKGTFQVSAPPHLVWDVLTDFDSMPRYVPSIRSSIPETLSDGGLLVTQEFEGKAFIFTRSLTVRLAVQEQPDRHIAFRDMSAKDFETYDGSWQLQALDGGTKVTYWLTAKPRAAVPGVFGRGAFKGGAAQMLSELQAEMVRRSTRQTSFRAKSDQAEGGTK